MFTHLFFNNQLPIINVVNVRNSKLLLMKYAFNCTFMLNHCFFFNHPRGLAKFLNRLLLELRSDEEFMFNKIDLKKIIKKYPHLKAPY